MLCPTRVSSMVDMMRQGVDLDGGCSNGRSADGNERFDCLRYK